MATEKKAVTINVRSRSQSVRRTEQKKLCQYTYEELNAGFAYELKATLELEFQEVPSTSLKHHILQQAREKWVELGYNDEKKRLADLKTLLNSQRVLRQPRTVSSPPHLSPPISAIHQILKNH